jgi:hypothetical protein
VAEEEEKDELRVGGRWRKDAKLGSRGNWSHSARVYSHSLASYWPHMEYIPTLWRPIGLWWQSTPGGASSPHQEERADSEMPCHIEIVRRCSVLKMWKLIVIVRGRNVVCS